MSRNISKLSGRKGLKDNLFKRMIDATKKNKNGKEIKQLADEYHVGMSTIHGAESFYEFLRPEHKEKKAWICNGSACMCAGTQDKVRNSVYWGTDTKLLVEQKSQELQLSQNKITELCLQKYLPSMQWS